MRGHGVVMAANTGNPYHKEHAMSYTTYAKNGTYGSGHTPCTILCLEDCRGQVWYCVAGSVNVNATFEPIGDGTDVEGLSDHDCFTSGEPIKTLEDLESACLD